MQVAPVTVLNKTFLGLASIRIYRVLGVEIESGKIKAWRDYFDLTTYQRDLG